MRIKFKLYRVRREPLSGWVIKSSVYLVLRIPFEVHWDTSYKGILHFGEKFNLCVFIFHSSFSSFSFTPAEGRKPQCRNAFKAPYWDNLDFRFGVSFFVVVIVIN